MTADRFTEVDRDLLADYVGGALDGTLDQALVATLIEERPAWAAAYDELLDASQLVQTVLAEWGSGVESIPQDVADRLNAALAAEPLTAGGQAPVRATADSTTADSAVAPTVDATASPLADATAGPAVVTRAEPARQNRPGQRPATPRSATRPGRSGRSRWQRYAAPVAVAAAAVAFAGLGLNQIFTGAATDESSTSAGGASDGQPQAESARSDPPTTMMETTGPQSPGRVLASGTDYRRSTIGPTVAGQSGDFAGQSGPGEDTVLQEPGPTPAGLARLARPTALTECLAAVSAEHGGVLDVSLVDYAAFEGRPALVIAFTDTVGRSWVWVSGPGCGEPVAGADTRYSAQVG
ncbi:hypothetical protein ACN27F_19170 [Solwaraspora sp. WMMB335]|uniref:hypothetical protein n=1 Tax=Solwaraspora sp. WMMB335 TaxID=3404118 RepID=UPI003B92569F